MDHGIPIYIIDDDAGIARLVSKFAVAAGHRPQHWSSALDFTHVAGDLPMGCIVLDIAMPGLSGLELLEGLSREGLSWPVVMLSGTTQVDDAIRAFNHGAIQFLRKPFKRVDLEGAFERAAGMVAAKTAEAERCLKGRSIRLTAREFQILRALDEGLPTKTIATNLGLSLRTVDMHRGNVFRKFSTNSAMKAVSRAREWGLLGSSAPIHGTAARI